jgi:hypothetical protein
MNLDVGNFPRGAILEILEEAKRGEPEFGQLHYRPAAVKLEAPVKIGHTPTTLTTGARNGRAKWAREMGARNGRATR